MKHNVNKPELEPCSVCRECSNPRYPVLRSIMSSYKLLAWAIAAGAIAISVFTGLIFDLNQALPVILLALFSGIVGFINFMAVSEAILVFLDIEENTRIMSKC